MRCPQCGAELLPGKKFCHACGASAQASCRSCGEPLDPGFRFCPECGTSVDPAAGPRPAPAPSPRDPLLRHIPEGLAAKIRSVGAVAGERKRATVLFCDLVGSTAIAEGLDPERYRELLDQFLEIAFAEIYRYEGIVNQMAGDGFMALFGAPIAHEDAPERAVCAALGIQEALARLGDRLVAERGIELTARIGIHTGTVVVGTMGNDLKTDYTAIGDTTNLAARLQALAAPGSILVSESTHVLIRDRFRTKPAGPFEVKGKSAAVQAYEVLELSDVTPMGIAEARGLTPLVGREPELAQLEACFRRLDDHLAQVVAIVGDAGTGKSRLIHEFRKRIAASDAFVLEGHCSSMTRAVPYAPWERMMRRFFGVTDASCAEATGRVYARVAEICGDDVDRVAPYLCTMLGLPLPEGAVGPKQINKQEFFDAMARLVGHASGRRPVVMIVEDLHWIDDASLEMLEMAVAVSHMERLMLIVTHRPEFRPRWQSQGAFTQLHLRLLNADEARAIVRARAGGPLPPALEHRLLQKGEGNPFFLEELTRALVEQGTLVPEAYGVRVEGGVESVLIPDTVQEVLGARLDRLRPASKRVAQIASVFGRQFRGEQLAELLEEDAQGAGIDVEQELAELEKRGVIHRNGLSSDEFRFGESLTQQVAYEGLLLRERRGLHERVGRLLQSAQPEGAPADRASLAVIGHHLALGEEREKGVLTLLEAADQAAALPSYGDALRLYRKCWDLAEAGLEESHNGGGHLRQAALRAIRGVLSVVMVFGESRHEENERAVARGLQLAEELEDIESRLILTSIAANLLSNTGRDRFAEAIVMHERIVDEARQAGMERTVAQLSRPLSWSYLGDGRFDDARRTIAGVLEVLERLGDREQLTDTYMGARFFRNRILYEADAFDEVLPSLLETYDLATSCQNRTIETATSSQLAALYYRLGHHDEAWRWARLGYELAEKIDNAAAIRSCGIVLLGLHHRRDPSSLPVEKLDRLERGIRGGGDMSMNLDVIVEILLSMGEVERAGRLAEAGAESTGGRLREARNEVSLGMVALRRGSAADARRHLERGLALGREIGSRSTVARAQLGLAELASQRDPQAGAACAKEALETFRALGMGHYEAQASKLIDAAGAAAAR